MAYETADGTATAPADYLPASGELVFEPGQRSGTVSIVIRADDVREDDEHFFLNLLSSSNATIAVAQGTGSIRRGGPRAFARRRFGRLDDEDLARLNRAILVFLGPAAASPPAR